MKSTVLQFISDLEHDIADFYKKMKTLTRFTRSSDLFTYMSNHSRQHANTVQELTDRYSKPEMDNIFIRSVFEQIKESLFEEVKNAADLPEAIRKIARAEELVGKMYIMMAKHYENLAVYYQTIAKEIAAIAEEEFGHRDMVLSESKKYIP